MKKTDYKYFPKRFWRSPCVEYANFEDGSFVNLIRLIKPYANGISWGVYETTKSTFCSNGMFKSYDKAKEKFELMVKNGSIVSPLKKRGLTGN